ncbi:MAG: SDR family NAD(P)-dependent oxidoreductase [Nitrospirota bacterium]|nr:SDR family NAD(P)-dependent oxidoreductase [Nitrospirota bacterium]MDH5585147.1 SDR family NAD(P)-dependent oxidoreductase [Nitrospirota bacterium]MDH5773375.1 SDR family NAD(P)-dependent oxidoreductase [Nitrospirota bacterium]
MPKKILLIGNSDGIGAAVTRSLLAQGHQVVGVSRSPSPLGIEGPRHMVLDISDPHYPETLRRLMAEEGPFDTCIFCAAIGSGLHLPDLSQEAKVIDVNFTAMVHTLATLLPGWLKQGQGHFIGLSSLADDFYNTDAPSYTASKAGFSNYLVAMALKLKSQGISITNIRFGFVDTKLPKASWKPLMMTPDQAATYVMRCLTTKPIQLSVPKILGFALYGIRWIQSLRIWLS